MVNRTIFALSSGRPPAAVSVIRLSGPRAHEAAASIAGPLPAVRAAGLRRLRDPASGALLDQAIVLRFDGPASATGEDVVEFHCHGGRAIVDAVLAKLDAIEGLRPAVPGEFTRRAFENGRIDLTEAEGLADLIEAETEAQRKAALAVVEGALSRVVEDWRGRVLVLSARAEQAIDYDDDDTPFDVLLAEECESLARELGDWLARPRAELLKNGVLVVVAGPPNAGKSSLINAISGEERVIVTDVPGTTRDSIEVPLSLHGVPIRLTDTAGLRTTYDKVEAIGVERAGKLVRSADILLWLGELGDAPDHERMLVLHAKADLPERQEAPKGAIAVSSITHAGLDILLDRIESLARSLLPSDHAFALNRRQAGLVNDARDALASAAVTGDLVLCAEALREARFAFDRMTGRAGVEDVLDALFSRFCLGK